MRMTLLPRPSAGSGHTAFIVVAAWGLTTVVGLVIVATVMTSPSHAGTATGQAGGPALPRTGTIGSAPVRAGALPVRNNEPLIAARQMTIAEARATAGYPIPLPHASAASQANLTRVWMDSKHEVALVFDNGKITITMQPATYRDPKTRFETFISENRSGKVAMGSVNGQPALVISPNTDAPKTNPAWVKIYRNGTDINVYSHDYGTATLLKIAASIK